MGSRKGSRMGGRKGAEWGAEREPNGESRTDPESGVEWGLIGAGYGACLDNAETDHGGGLYAWRAKVDRSLLNSSYRVMFQLETTASKQCVLSLYAEVRISQHHDYRTMRDYIQTATPRKPIQELGVL